jgi:glutamine synthetase type III
MIVPNNGASDLWKRIEAEKESERRETVFCNKVFADDKLKQTLTKEENAAFGK